MSALFLNLISVIITSVIISIALISSSSVAVAVTHISVVSVGVVVVAVDPRPSSAVRRGGLAASCLQHRSPLPAHVSSVVWGGRGEVSGRCFAAYF